MALFASLHWPTQPLRKCFHISGWQKALSVETKPALSCTTLSSGRGTSCGEGWQPGARAEGVKKFWASGLLPMHTPETPHVQETWRDHGSFCIFEPSTGLLRSYRKVFNLDNDALSAHFINTFPRNMNLKNPHHFVGGISSLFQVSGWSIPLTSIHRMIFFLLFPPFYWGI